MSFIQLSASRFGRAFICQNLARICPSVASVPFRSSFEDILLGKATSAFRYCSNESSSKSDSAGEEDKVSNTSVFVQDGLNIDELPCIVRIVRGEFIVNDGAQTRKSKNVLAPGIESKSPTEHQKPINYEEEVEMIQGFFRCSTLTELYFLLCQCPEDEVTPPVAFSVIRNMIQLENNKKFRNPAYRYLQDQPEETPISELMKGAGAMTPIPENFTRAAVMERLVDKICKGADTVLVLDTVKALRKDTSSCDKTAYIKRLCDKCLILVSEGKLTVSQIAALAQDLHLLKSDLAKSYTDKLWTGLEENTEDLDENEVSELFSMLPFISQSRKHVYHLAERRALSIWYKFKPDHILQMICILVTCQCNCYRLLGAISRWMNVHIHTLTEGHLRWMMFAFNKLNFTSSNLQKALTRYAKAKKSVIADPSLVASLMDYSAAMRFRSPEVMEMSAAYFIANHAKLNVPDIYSICQAFGSLNYVPKDGFTFFKVLEDVLNKNFVAFSPDAFVDLLMTCVYLERYPLNFIDKVYHPFFFQRLEVLSPNDIKQTRTKLRILDKALSLETSCHKKRVVSKSFASNGWMFRDVRIAKCVNQIRHVVEDIAGSANRVHTAVSPTGFPFVSFYKVDCLVDLSIKSEVFESLMPDDCNERFALLIHLPEHYDVSRRHFLGPHAMKIRQLNVAGFKVVNLDYENIQKLLFNSPALKSYLLNSMTEALR
ncbi:FAST kinase domain-containing protein 3, mitochondrial [Hyalella azteca]|uniref:FAST kinase domain-containing protein 3, mitochondrial n=1 Tax=Hyalella azteca TaxID=294128 RepID=A0A8B7PE56_HYAAZ|nr:FAST kinase domain-containing protein 3, mitochondrial [Hyalella azteca]